MLFGIPESVHPNLANEMYCCFVPLLSSVYNKPVLFFFAERVRRYLTSTIHLVSTNQN